MWCSAIRRGSGSSCRSRSSSPPASRRSRRLRTRRRLLDYYTWLDLDRWRFRAWTVVALARPFRGRRRDRRIARFVRVRPRPRDFQARQPYRAACGTRPRLQALHELAGGAPRTLQGQGSQSSPHHHPAHRPGYFSRRPDGLLGWPLPDDRHHRRTQPRRSARSCRRAGGLEGRTWGTAW